MNALQASDAILFGFNRYIDWLQRFEAQWNAGDMMIVDIAWSKLPPEVKQAILISAPDDLAAILKEVEGYAAT